MILLWRYLLLKKELEPSAILEPAILNKTNVYQFT